MTEPSRSRLPSLGTRGEGWVILQLLGIAGIVAAGTSGPAWPDGARGWTRAAGTAVGLTGMVLGFGGIVALRRNLTPFPQPLPDAALVEHGVYARVRHPAYGGLVLLGLAASLWTSPLALVPELFLGAVLEMKRRREEAWLADRYPGYRDYRARVPRALIPFVW